MTEIELTHVNKIKIQKLKLQKTASVWVIVPRRWFDDNFIKQGEVSIHRVAIDNEDCLVIKKIKSDKK